MIGTIVNTCCIIAGSFVGSLMRKGIDEKYRVVLFDAMGLASIALGASAFTTNIAKSEFPVLFIASLAIGGLIGTRIGIAQRVEAFAQKKGASQLMQGITTASLLYCIGTLSIVGPILSALQGDNTYLFTNSTLDLVSSTIFGATYGVGMIWAAPILFCWQGSIYAIAKLASSSPLLQGTLVNDLGVIGGVLIICSGLSILNIKDCKTMNLLPSLIVPVIWHLVLSLF
ncbi:MAG: DUF554 domain-containing protein [Bacteroidales bacterium]|nr:DUF554 domain-containing protein [Bacteroidales bacterium]